MHQTRIIFFLFSSGVAGAGLALTPINHSFTGQEIAKQVNLLPMLLFYIQVEAASSKWVVTDTSSKRRIFEALGESCTPAFISADGEKHLSIFLIQERSPISFLFCPTLAQRDHHLHQLNTQLLK